MCISGISEVPFLMTSPFEGKVAIVTGGSRGIGLAIASALVARGASVTVSGLDAARLADAGARLSKAVCGGGVQTLQADVRDSAQAGELVEATVKRFGGLDILVNNAGVGKFAGVAEMTADDWHRMIDTNLTGVFHCCHAAIPHLRRRGGGWIIGISSLAGDNAFPGGAGYCATKAGLNAFSEALMQELRYDDIRVSYIMPGSVDTGFGGQAAAAATDWKIAPEDVAQVVTDLIEFPRRSLPSRIELRPSKPPRK
jgi:NAD(P)-dependent dehydrogenase (short-subunit alcohol dehydrogenase family)